MTAARSGDVRSKRRNLKDDDNDELEEEQQFRRQQRIRRLCIAAHIGNVFLLVVLYLHAYIRLMVSWDFLIYEDFLDNFKLVGSLS